MKNPYFESLKKEIQRLCYCCDMIEDSDNHYSLSKAINITKAEIEEFDKNFELSAKPFIDALNELEAYKISTAEFAFRFTVSTMALETIATKLLGAFDAMKTFKASILDLLLAMSDHYMAYGEYNNEDMELKVNEMVNSYQKLTHLERLEVLKFLKS